MVSMNTRSPLICLASVSPRRRELLAQIGVPHIIVGADIDETAQIGEAPRDYVSRMARQKALTVRERGESLPVLAADTTVVLDDVIYGKPRDRADGLAMLGRLSGRTHAVLTAVALADARGVAVQLSVSTVRFRDLSSQECAEYWETGEPHDKAERDEEGGFHGCVLRDSVLGQQFGRPNMLWAGAARRWPLRAG